MKRIARNRLKSFRFGGSLTLPEIVAGIRACLANGRQQCHGGELLAENGFRGSAVAAYLIAQQELGKIWVLKRMVTLKAEDADRWRSCWKDFRNHGAKNLSTQQMLGATEHSDAGSSLFWSLLEFDRDRSEPLEQARQASLYVDFIEEDRDWWVPNDLTAEIVGLARARAEKLLTHVEIEWDVGLLSTRALEVFRTEFENWRPEIEVGTEYEPREFDELVIGLRGPYRRFLRRLVDEGILHLGDHEMTVLSEPLDEFLDA